MRNRSFCDGMAKTSLPRCRDFKSCSSSPQSSFTSKGKPSTSSRSDASWASAMCSRAACAGGGKSHHRTLIDATSGAHLWADRFDGSLEIFLDLRTGDGKCGRRGRAQARGSEIERAHRSDGDASTLTTIIARPGDGFQYSKPQQESVSVFRQCDRSRSGICLAYPMATRCISLRGKWLADKPGKKSPRIALAAGHRIGRDDPLVLAVGGYVIAYSVTILTAALRISLVAVAQCNSALTWLYSGAAHILLASMSWGSSSVARQRLSRSIDAAKFMFDFLWSLLLRGLKKPPCGRETPCGSSQSAFPPFHSGGQRRTNGTT